MITLLLLVRATFMHGVVLHAHPVRGESHNQRNTTGEVATIQILVILYQLFKKQYFHLRYCLRKHYIIKQQPNVNKANDQPHHAQR